MTPTDYLIQQKILMLVQSDYPSANLNPFANSLFAKKDRVLYPSFQPISASKSKNTNQNCATKQQIVKWFLSLPHEELMESLVIDNIEFIPPFLKTASFGNNQTLFHLTSGKKLSNFTGKASDQKFFKEILKNIRIAWSSDPQIYIQDKDLNPKKILSWFEGISEGKIFDYPLRNLNKQKPEQNLLWFNWQSYHSIEAWLVSEFEKSILRYYFKPQKRIQKIQSLKKYMKQKKASANCIRCLEFKVQETSNEGQDELQKYQDSLKGYEENFRIENQEKMLEFINVQIKKKKKKKKTKKIQSQEKTDVNKQKEQHIKKLQQQKKYQQQIGKEVEVQQNKALQVEQIVEQKPQKRNFVHLEKRQKRKYSPESPTKSPVKLDKTDSLSALINFEDSPQDHDKKSTQTITYQHTIKSKQGHFQDEVQNDKKKKRRRHKNQCNVIRQFKLKAQNYLINKQLCKFVDNISIQSNSIYQSKVIAFERVSFYIKFLFPMAETILFGSNAVGLSLLTSDIDLMVTSIPLRSREEANQVLAQIAIQINKMGWVLSCSTYTNAKVPIVKLEIDPSISYFITKRRSDFFPFMDPKLLYSLDMKDLSKAAIIKVDITINIQENSKVSLSTQLMRNWISEDNFLHRIILVLKYILVSKGFSQNFRGGIGSYCLFIMVAAYFSEFKEKIHDNQADILMDILKFYGESFQNQLKIIVLSTQNKKTCFPTLEEYFSNNPLEKSQNFTLLRIEDPLNSKIMSSSCNQFNFIKTEFRRVRNEILQLDNSIQKEAQNCFNNSGQITKLMANKKSFEKWVNKYEIRSGFCLKNIIHGNSEVQFEEDF